MGDENEPYQRKQRIIETMRWWDADPSEELREHLAALVMRVEDLEAARATVARIREICAVEYDTASDLRADILAELGEP